MPRGHDRRDIIERSGANRLQLSDHLERTVASVCDVCGKGPGFGNNISHSHRRTRRRWNPNIQTVRAVISGTPKRLNVCTSCIKAGKVTR
jgi:large subunit ribosomal protein L28